MKRFTSSVAGLIGRNSMKKLAAAAVGICLLAPMAQARDHDRDKDVDFGVRADDHGNVGLDLSFIGGRDHGVRERSERIWVDPVWKCETDRIWVDAVYENQCQQVWCKPVTKDVCTKVWVEPTFEVRETTSYDHGRQIVRRERVQVAPGHYDEQHSTVVVTEGHYKSVDNWVLKCDGHWETKERWVCASDGHWEDRVIREAPLRTERVERLDLHFGGR